MSAQPLPWPKDANYFRGLLFHLREPVMLPKQNFEQVWDYVGTVYTMQSRNTSVQEIIHYECCFLKKQNVTPTKSNATGSITCRRGYSLRDLDLCQVLENNSSV
jgi:hypothetical protein